MHFKHLHTFLLLGLVVMMSACKSEVDLQNINSQAELELGVAFPVGSLRATIGDFLGGGQVEQIRLDEDGIFHYMDTINLPTKDYHKIKIKEYVLENEKAQSFFIKPKVEKEVIKGGEDYVLSYDFGLSTAKFKREDPTYERIDKIRVKKATFTSKIRTSDFNLKWSEIQKVQLVLGDQFTREDGNTITIPIKNFAFNKDIPITVDNFDLDMSDGNGGTTDKIKFKIKFFVAPGNNRSIEVTDDSKFSYTLTVGEIDYVAIWGFFEAGSDMRDHQRISLDSVWGDWQNIKKLKLRFMEPKAEIFVTHKIAAPLIMHVDYIEAINANGEHKKATWTNDGVTNDYFNFPLENRLSIADYTIGDSITNRKDVDNTPGKGHIDELFDVRPDTINYSFWLSIDRNYDKEWPQHRIIKDDTLRAYVVADIPFKINEGSEMEYSTLLDSVNISDFSLDSILASAQVFDSVRASDIKLILDIQNGLPFALKGSFIFYDEFGKQLDLHLFENDVDSLNIPAPEMEVTPETAPYGRIVKESSQRIIVSVERNDFDKLSQIHSIQMEVAMVDNPAPSIITKDTELCVRIGIAARVDAILDFDKDKENQ